MFEGLALKSEEEVDDFCSGAEGGWLLDLKREGDLAGVSFDRLKIVLDSSDFFG